MDQLQVTLPPEYDKQLKESIIKVIYEAIEEAKQASKINSPWLSSKREAYNYLGMAPQTFEDLLKRGLPYHIAGKKMMFNKQELNKFILEK